MQQTWDILLIAESLWKGNGDSSKAAVTYSFYNSAHVSPKNMKNGLFIFRKIIPWKTSVVCLNFTHKIVSHDNSKATVEGCIWLLMHFRDALL